MTHMDMEAHIDMDMDMARLLVDHRDYRQAGALADALRLRVAGLEDSRAAHAVRRARNEAHEHHTHAALHELSRHVPMGGTERERKERV